MIKVERHIFGSIDGYRTLAHSSGLTTADCKLLEGFSFGTAYDAAVRSSFSTRPAYWSRPLGGSRRALTLVRAGPPDDAGRSTLLFVTVVIENGEWNDALQGDASPLLRRSELWQWASGSPVAALDVSIERPARLSLDAESLQTVLRIISRIEVSWGTGRTVKVREPAIDLEQITVIERLLPPDIRLRFSAVYRGLNSDMPVSLNCLAQNAIVSTNMHSLQGPLSPYAMHLAQARIPEGRDPEAIVKAYVHFAQPIVETSANSDEEEPMANGRYRGRGWRGRYGILRGCFITLWLRLSACAEPTDSRFHKSILKQLLMLTAVALSAFVAGGATGRLIFRQEPLPPPKASPWPAIIDLALDIPLTLGDKQIRGLDELNQAVNRVVDENNPGLRDRWLGTISIRIEDAKLASSAVTAIQEAKVGDERAIALATTAIEKLKNRNVFVHAALSADWKSREQLLKPRKDRFVELVKWLNQRAESIEAPTGQASQPASPDSPLEAESLEYVMRLIAHVDSNVEDSKFKENREKLKRIAAQRSDSSANDRQFISAKEAESLKLIQHSLESLKTCLTSEEVEPNAVPLASVVAKRAKEAASACTNSNLERYEPFAHVFSALGKCMDNVRLVWRTEPEPISVDDAELRKILGVCIEKAEKLRKSNGHEKDEALKALNDSLAMIRKWSQGKTDKPG